MSKKLLTGLFLVAVFCFLTSCISKKDKEMICKLKSSEDIKTIFPTSIKEINERVEVAKISILAQVKKIVEEENKNWTTIAESLDNISDISDPIAVAIETIVYVHPNDELRAAAQAASIAFQKFCVENIGLNKELYNAFKEYAENIAPKENLTASQKYFIKETLKSFERSGLGLSDDKLAKVKQLMHDLSELSQQFEVNIATDNRTIKVKEEELEGLSEHFIKSLKKDENLFIIGVDYPTYTAIMEDCAITETRRKLYLEFVNRAYPKNKAVLEKIIAKRDEVAKLLGFESYSHLNLDSLMVKKPETAYEFLSELFIKAEPKAEEEREKWLSELPKSIILTPDGKLQPWDSAFLKTYYKKKHLSYDKNIISEYFPMESTVQKLLNIYEKFFDLKFKISPIKDLWHNDLQVIEVYKDNKKIGYIVLDLYPRPNKYSHACQIGILPAVTKNGTNCPALVVVVANFPKSSGDKPALLKFNDVNTFFHEFGHAIHSLLGRTELYSFAGTSVKRDFVEMPSQMLENWLKDKEVLKMVSSHYKTGQPLPYNLIEIMAELERFDSGNFITRQIGLALLSLDFYAEGQKKDLDHISRELADIVAPHIKRCPEEHFWASFGHLIGYGAGYYGYLWSDVFSKDLFEQINQEGLLSPEAGKRYANAILVPGGSKHPEDLLHDYLGRKPSQDAYFRAKGL